jgi:hypothetical protein
MEPNLVLSAPALLPGLDKANIEKLLPRASHNLDFLVMATAKYIHSAGLIGLLPMEYFDENGVSQTAVKDLRPSILSQLNELGVLDSASVPFGLQIGLVPSTAFLRLVIQHPDIFPSLIAKDRKCFSSLSNDLVDSSSAGIEKRWLTHIAKSILTIDYGEAMSVSLLARSLPEADCKVDYLSQVIFKMHDSELITWKAAKGQGAEISTKDQKNYDPESHYDADAAPSRSARGGEFFLCPDFYGRLEDKVLVEKLLDKNRKAPRQLVENPMELLGIVPEDRVVPKHQVKPIQQAPIKKIPQPSIVTHIKQPDAAKSKRSRGKTAGDAPKMRNRIPDLLKENIDGLTLSDLQDKLGSEYTGIKYHLNNLRKTGRLEEIGSGASKRFKIKDPPQS